MSWRRIGYWSSLGTAALFVLALAWLWTADLGVFRPQIERWLSAELGRDLRIERNLSIDLAPRTTVIAEGVRIANPVRAGGGDMVAVGRMEIRVDLWSLVSGPPVIDLLAINDASIRLVNPGDAEPNWVLPAADQGVRERSPRGDGAGFLLHRVALDHVEVRLESVHRQRPIELLIERLDQRHREDDFLAVELRGRLDGRPVEVNGEVGTWGRLRAGRDVDFALEALLGTLTLSGEGRIDRLAGPQRPEVRFRARGPDIDDLTGMLALGDAGEGDIELAASLVPRAGGPLELELEGNLGPATVDASGTVTDLQGLEGLALRADASGPDLGAVLRLAGIHRLRDAPFSARLDVQKRGRALVVERARMQLAGAEFDGAARLPHFPGIDDAVARLEIQGSELERLHALTGMPETATGPFSGDFRIDVGEDGSEVFEVQLATAFGELRADGRVVDPGTLFGSHVQFRLRGDSLARLADAYRLRELPDRAFELAGAVEYTEAGIRTLGPLRAEVEAVSVEAGGLITLNADLRGTELDLVLAGDDLAALVGGFADPAGVPSLPFAARGGVRVDDEGVRFRELNGSVGRSAIRAEGLLVVPEITGSRIDLEASGPALEELFARLDGVEIRPGPYDLSAEIAFHREVIDVANARLDRAAGQLRLDLQIGLPLSRQWLGLDLRARSEAVGSLLPGLRDFEWREQPLAARLQGNLRGRRLKIDALEVAVGEASIEAAGTLDFRDPAAGTALELALDLPNLAALGTVGGRAMRERPVSMEMRVIGREGRFETERLWLQIGESELVGTLAWQPGEVPGIEATLRSDELVLAPLLEPPDEAAPEAEVAAGRPPDDGRLIPAAALPFDAMRALDASLELDIERLQRGPLLLRDVVLEARLENGVLDMPVAGFTAASGKVRARGRLDPADGAGAASLELVARDFAPGVSENNRDLEMTGDVDINLRATGKDLRALAGSLEGAVLVDIRGGRIANNRALRALYGDLLEEILSTINPFRKQDPYTTLECAVVAARLNDGIWQAAPNSYIATGKVRIVTKSRIDLKDEKIRIGIRTTPKRIVSISAAELVNPYVEVVGTLARPRLALDQKGALLSGGAAVATGGMSIIAEGLWNRLTRAGDSCRRASEAAIAELGERLPTLAIEGATRHP